jgi:hypothetical protein
LEQFVSREIRSKSETIMQLYGDRFAHKNSPEWLVSNGTTTVGPVETELLLRGVMHGRVPNHALVREVGWQAWRQLGQIREVCALRRMLDRSLEQDLTLRNLRDSTQAVAEATDPGEVLLIALHAAAHATSATVGLLHRIREPLFLPTTSCVFEGSIEVLGRVLPWFDPAFTLARSGKLVLGPAHAGAALRAVSLRLADGSPLCGVAMLPISVGGVLCAMLELGKSDHPFRASDAAELEEFAIKVGLELGRVGELHLASSSAVLEG